MADLNIEKFNPSTAELQALVAQSKTLTLPDLRDKEQLKKIKEARLILRSARTNITKTGKALREDALEFQRAVLAKERELIAIVEPEEMRLETYEQAAKRVQERDERVEFLPRRKERLAALDDGIAVSDDELLDMDGSQFEGYFNKRLADKNEKERQRLADEQRRIDEEKAKLAREAEIREREEKARLEGEARAKAQIEAQKQADEKAAKEKADREAREADEKKIQENNLRLQRERSERYQKFLAEHGWTPETKGEFMATEELGKVVLWKKQGIFTG